MNCYMLSLEHSEAMNQFLITHKERERGGRDREDDLFFSSLGVSLNGQFALTFVDCRTLLDGQFALYWGSSV